MAPKFAGNIHTEDANLISLPINISTIGSNTVIAGTAGKVIKVYRLILDAAVANTITFLDGTTPLSGPVFLAANQGLFFRFDTKPWLDTSPGNDFNINLASANQVSGVLYYTSTVSSVVVVTPTPPLTPANGYVAEDGLTFYVAEDGVTFYVQES